MNKEQQEQFDTAYKLLSPVLKEIIDSQETAQTIYNTGQKYGLHIDQLGALANTVHLVILGLIRASDFTSELTKRVGVSGDVANLIVYDLNQQIFSKIRQEMQKTSQIAESATETKPETEPARTSEKTPEQVVEQKLSSVTNVPTQEVEVKPQTGDNKDTGDTAAAVPARDPYRELP